MDIDNLKLVDENGEELNLSIIDTFILEEKQYVILVNPLNMESDAQVYVLQMNTLKDDSVEFVVPDEADTPKVIEEASRILNAQGSFNGCSSGCDGCSGCGGH